MEIIGQRSILDGKGDGKDLLNIEMEIRIAIQSSSINSCRKTWASLVKYYAGWVLIGIS
jgi:hypothetical protein